jgi:hypothetical protein
MLQSQRGGPLELIRFYVPFSADGRASRRISGGVVESDGSGNGHVGAITMDGLNAGLKLPDCSVLVRVPTPRERTEETAGR